MKTPEAFATEYMLARDPADKRYPLDRAHLVDILEKYIASEVNPVLNGVQYDAWEDGYQTSNSDRDGLEKTENPHT